MVKKTEIERTVSVTTTKVKPDHPHGGPPGQEVPPPTEPPPTTEPPPVVMPPIVIEQPPIVTPPDVGVGFNGGRSQINFNFLQYGGAHAFLNVIKGGQKWEKTTNDGPPAPDTLDANGYPISGGVYTLFYIPAIADRSANYVVKWTGAATVYLADAVGSPSWSDTDGRHTFTADPSYSAPADGWQMRVQITANTNISNLIICHVDDEALIDAGYIFGTRFKAKLAEGKFGVLRFLNWQRGNTTNMRTWADRRPVGYAYYHGPELRASIYSTSCSHSGNAYSCPGPPAWGGLVDKAMVTVKFDADATSGTCTLNVATTGAKPIYSPYGQPIDPVAQTYWWPKNGIYGTLVYDADLDAWIKQGGDTDYGDWFLDSGVPPELMLQLCAEVGAHPWFCTPMFACDPVTDWITGLATYCRDNAPAWMIPRYEVVPNELWNFHSQFYQTPYAQAKAFVRWGTADEHNWVGKAASLMGQAVSAVYSANRDRYQAIVGVHTTYVPTSSQNARLASTLYVAEGGGKTPASDWITHVTCATYWNDTYTSAQRSTAAAAYAGGDLTQPGWFVASAEIDLGGDQYYASLPRTNDYYVAWKAWAAGYGVDGLCAYEGGWSPDYTGDATVDAFLRATKDVAALATQITTNYTNFVNAGGEFPSCFDLSGTGGIWHIFDPDIYATPSTQWSAIGSFSA